MTNLIKRILNKLEPRKALDKFYGLEKLEKALVFIVLFAFIGTGTLLLTHAAPNPYIAPPTNLSLDEASSTEAAINWSASTDPQITGYQVLRNGNPIATTDKYTTNYLDQNLVAGTSYNYSIEALDGSSSSSPTSTLAVTTGQTTQQQVISQCGVWLTAGNYILDTNLTDTTTNDICLTIADTSDISLDCQGHSILATADGDYGIDLDTISNVLLVNCNITSPNPVISSNATSNSMLANNTFNSPGLYDFWNNSSLSIENNSCPNWCDIQVSGNSGGYNYIGFNTIDNPVPQNMVNGIYPQEIYTSQSYNVIDGNNLVGDATTYTQTGLDDGIVFGNDSNTSMVNNNITKDFDCGIEGSGPGTDDLIANNNISYVYSAGICSYYDTSWTGITVADNKVTNSSSLFTIYVIPEPGQKLPHQVYFKNNQFISNSYTEPNSLNLGPIYIDMSVKKGKVLSSGNDIFANNSFEDNSATSLIKPFSMVVDGGDNICSSSTSKSTKLHCRSSVPTISIDSPMEGDVLSGTATLSASANGSQGQGISKVIFSIDNKQIATDSGTQSSYTANWNTTTVSDGAHTLSVTVTDQAGLNATISENLYTINSDNSSCSSAPSTPTSLTEADQTNNNSQLNQINLSWSGGAASPNCETAGYHIYRDNSKTPFANIPAGTYSYTDTNLTNAFYSYQIATYDTYGHESPLSSSLTATTSSELDDCDSQHLPIPIGPLVNNIASTSIGFSWVPPLPTDGCQVSGYNIYQVTKGKSPVLLAKVSSSTTNYLITGLNTNSTYRFSVAATYSNGDVSPLSAGILMTTK